MLKLVQSLYILKRLSRLEVSTHINNQIRISHLKMLVARNLFSVSKILAKKINRVVHADSLLAQ